MTDQQPEQQSENRLFGRGSFTENSRIAEILRAETTGGILLIIGAAIALIWANIPVADAYFALRDYKIGPELLGFDLNLSLGTWAADGLLAIFFFVAGLELKREFVAGDLRDRRRAALPIAAAVGGMAAPAIVFTIINLGTDTLKGWAIPTATDIAFAVAVLAVISTHLPSGLRTFLLTLAVVDDLLAITIIAIFYTDSLEPLYLLAALVPIGAFAYVVQKRLVLPWLLIPLALVAWVLVHESGVHATVAGVVLGFTVPVIRSQAAGGPEAGPGMAEYFEHAVRPLSAGFAVPVFAFFAAGVAVGGFSGLADSLSSKVAIGIVAGLVIGKAVGIAGSTWVLHRFTSAQLDDELSWWDVIGMSMLAGIGFTVSLLIGELAFGTGETDDQVKVGVLVGSLISALLATVILRARNRVYKRLTFAETLDVNKDGVPDVYDKHWDTGSGGDAPGTSNG